MPRSPSNRNNSQPGADSLERLALRYVERYATTRAKLTRYLERKMYEYGGTADDVSLIPALVERLAELGYVNDRQFAEMRMAALARRGYGRRRIDADLRTAGIDAEDAEIFAPPSDEEALAAAMRFAQRKRLGPFSEKEPDSKAYNRAFAAMVRAGHPLDIIREILTNEKRY